MSFARVLSPFLRPVIIGALRLSNAKPSRIGTCRFYGSTEFVNRCAEALKELEDLDSNLHCQLTTVRPYVFWFHNNVFIDDRFNRFHTIPEGYLDWGRNGIIARYVYAVFIDEMIGDSTFQSWDVLYLKYDAVRIRTQEWLKARGFPAELIAPLEESATESLRKRKQCL